MEDEAQAHLPSSVRAVTKPCATNDVHPTMVDEKRHDRVRVSATLSATRAMKRFQKSLVALEQDLMKTKADILNTNEYFKEMSRVKIQGQGRMGASLRKLVDNVRGKRLQRVQAHKYIQVRQDFDALIQVIQNDCRAEFNMTGLEDWKREVKRLHMACKACTERVQTPEVCSSPPQVQPSQEQKSSIQPFDLSETEPTLVVPFAIEDATDSPPLTPPTPEALLPNQQLPRALTPLNNVTVGAVSPTWPETSPAVGYLTPPCLAPIQNLSTVAKKLLQELEELQQDVTEEKKIGKGEKTYVKQLTVLEVSSKQPEGNNVKEEIKKKKKNVGKRFLQWLSRKLICGCCSDV
ncbi:uncharacterized protein LOC124468002 [Hypomesus transpacificus]|uniref:uncharacterized protein LOC124465673 n=1 Tax=Hypomesus transpacificus TaxID=137520 RepID=UPI001F07B145|nr:uncharacterized protein LOC124465673 [Hypomesus transpacificus]XP_046876508.1 uncharacterized protein LOC124468002 [Hypomesus transpacificus]